MKTKLKQFRVAAGMTQAKVAAATKDLELSPSVIPAPSRRGARNLFLTVRDDERVAADAPAGLGAAGGFVGD